MATDVRLPREGSTTMTSAAVVAWHAEPGDEVRAGEPLVEVEGDKVTFDVAAPVDGTLLERCAEVGEEIDVGGVLARVGAPDEVPPSEAPRAEAQRPEAPRAEAQRPEAPRAGVQRPEAPLAEVRRPEALQPEPPRPRARPARTPASPAARRRARELGVDIGVVAGSGPGGRVRTADVEARADAAPAAGPSGARRIIAERMARSAAEAAAVTLAARADVTAITSARDERWSLPDVVVHAVAGLLPAHPDLNATLGAEGVRRHDGVHIGYAVDAPGGLVVPVIHDADRLGLAALSAARREAVRRARVGGLRPADVAGGTFTVTNLGPLGVEMFTPIITPGQSAVLGLGRWTRDLVPGSDGPAVACRLWLSLTFDHRIVDGAPAARFLQALASRLEHGASP